MCNEIYATVKYRKTENSDWKYTYPVSIEDGFNWVINYKKEGYAQIELYRSSGPEFEEVLVLGMLNEVEY